MGSKIVAEGQARSATPTDVYAHQSTLKAVPQLPDIESVLRLLPTDSADRVTGVGEGVVSLVARGSRLILTWYTSKSAARRKLHFRGSGG